MSEKSDKNWNLFFKILAYVATAVASFFTGSNAQSISNLF